MRCPTCHDEYEDGVRSCAECGSTLVPDDDPIPEPEPVADARLGRFHPAAAESVVRLLGRRGILHRIIPHDDDVEIQVDPDFRDDLRAELTLTWREILRLVEEERQADVHAEGGSTPGWHDAPRGGYIDRTGKLVVADEAEDEETDASRMVGPAMLTIGAITVVGGWYLVDSTALIVLGIGLVLVGLFSPR